MRKVTLTPEEVDRLGQRHAAGARWNELVSEFGHSFYILYNALKNVGAHKRFEYTEEQIVEAYRSGKDMRMIKKEFHISPETAAEMVKRHGIKMRDNRKYPIDPGVLDSMDENLAYFLGLFCADGWVHKPLMSFGVCLHQDDEELLIKIREWMKTDRPFYRPKGGGFKRSDDPSRCVNLHITHKEMCGKLAQHGLLDKKFNRLSIPPTIPSHLIHHFVRGAFDGDGSISITKRGQLVFNIAGYEPFIMEIAKTIEANVDIKAKVNFIQLNSDGSRFSAIKLSGNLQVPRLYEWLYRDATMMMDRKHGKFIRHQRVYSEWVAAGKLDDLGERFDA